MSDDSGRFQISGPFDGEYGISFQHPRLDSLGISADEQSVRLAHGATYRVTLFVPPESVVIRRLFRPGGPAASRRGGRGHGRAASV